MAREGIETTLLLWSMVQSFGDAPSALLGALLGLLAAVVLGWLLARGMLRLDLRRFFTWTGGFLVVVAAGVLAYALHDLQEAGALPGPFTAAAPHRPRDRCGRRRLAAFPFGWAFDVSHDDRARARPLAAILQATVGFMPADDVAAGHRLGPLRRDRRRVLPATCAAAVRAVPRPTRQPPSRWPPPLYPPRRSGPQHPLPPQPLSSPVRCTPRRRPLLEQHDHPPYHRSDAR